MADLGQLGTCCLPRSVNRTVLLDLLDHAIEIGVACAKAPCEPVPTALGYGGMARRRDSSCQTVSTGSTCDPSHRVHRQATDVIVR